MRRLIIVAHAKYINIWMLIIWIAFTTIVKCTLMFEFRHNIYIYFHDMHYSFALVKKIIL